MSNLFLKNFHLFFSKRKCSPPAAANSGCYFTSNPISSATAAADDFSSSSGDSISDDFAGVLASRRFFFSSPGRSNSILESSTSDVVVSEGRKVQKYSVDPYADFRRSMEEMIDAREIEINVRTDWDYLRELLSCYLRLNPKHTHKFIITAFADLLLSLLANSDHETATI